MPCHERALDTDLETVKATEWYLCKEPPTDLEPKDGVSTAKTHSIEVSGCGTVIELVEPNYGLPHICDVLGQNPKM